MRSPPRARRLVFLAVPLWAVALAVACFTAEAAPPPAAPGYLFCFWNCENFFDDRVDGWTREPDKTYDAWFANDKDALRQKLSNMTDVLAKMNDGKGPDVLALAECENERTVELLRDSLNARLKDNPPYKNILYRDPKGGRSIATAILTRLDVDRGKTRLHGSRVRILEGHIRVQNNDLVVFATHWTSRVSDREGTSRDRYADQVYGAVKAMYKSNPKVDVVVCGDFNDPPDDDSVTKHLHAIGAAKGDLEKVKSGGGADGPFLLDLMARPDMIGKKPERGTHHYRGTWYTFDQIVVSPGMLDREGWWCDPESMKVASEHMSDVLGYPKRFGDQRDRLALAARGASDHFPVTVRLFVK